MQRINASPTPPSRFRIYGHRGSPREHPENTIRSFEAALAAGADGFETDLRLLADSVAVLHHDDEIGEDEVETLRSEDFATRGAVVTAVHELAQFAGRCTMILEVKRGGWEDALISCIAGWDDIVISSFDHILVRELHRRGVAARLGAVASAGIVDIGEYLTRIGATWYFPHHRFVTPSMVAECAAAGIEVVPWTANRPRDWERLRDAGCAGVISDVPAAAVAWRKSLAG